MPDRERKSRRPYEAPTLIPLGELARGTGACATGTVFSNATGCTTGMAPGNKDCFSGGSPKKGSCGTGGAP